MATSDVEIVNFALSDLGQPQITSLTENTKAARFANVRYAGLRDAVLRTHPWNFAVKRRTLAQLVETPAFGWTRYFALPVDFLRLLLFNPTTTGGNWGLELSESSGRALGTDESAANIVYVAQVTNVGFFDTLFVETLAARIAWAMAMPIANSVEMTSQMRQIYERKLSEARSVDAMEGPPVLLDADDFIRARRGIAPFRPIEDAG